MMRKKTLARLVAAVVVAGGMGLGAVAPAGAATLHHTSSHVSPHDTGWNGT